MLLATLCMCMVVCTSLLCVQKYVQGYVQRYVHEWMAVFHPWIRRL